MLRRRLIHERFERSLLIHLQRRRIFQSLLRRFFLILVTAHYRLVLRARLWQFAAQVMRATEKVTRMNPEFLRERRQPAQRAASLHVFLQHEARMAEVIRG